MLKIALLINEVVLIEDVGTVGFSGNVACAKLALCVSGFNGTLFVMILYLIFL